MNNDPNVGWGEERTPSIAKAFRCWWFGCEPHPADPAPPDFLECQHCGELVTYGDLVGDTRHNRALDRALRLWRMVWRKKCPDCGRRFRPCDEQVEHIPF
jgi:hypothetical protein